MTHRQWLQFPSISCWYLLRCEVRDINTICSELRLKDISYMKGKAPQCPGYIGESETDQWRDQATKLNSTRSEGNLSSVSFVILCNFVALFALLFALLSDLSAVSLRCRFVFSSQVEFHKKGHAAARTKSPAHLKLLGFCVASMCQAIWRTYIYIYIELTLPKPNMNSLRDLLGSLWNRFIFQKKQTVPLAWVTKLRSKLEEIENEVKQEAMMSREEQRSEKIGGGPFGLFRTASNARVPGSGRRSLSAWRRSSPG